MIIVIDTPDAIRAATEYSEYMRGHDIVILMRYNKNGAPINEQLVNVDRARVAMRRNVGRFPGYVITSNSAEGVARSVSAVGKMLCAGACDIVLISSDHSVRDAARDGVCRAIILPDIVTVS